MSYQIQCQLLVLLDQENSSHMVDVLQLPRIEIAQLILVDLEFLYALFPGLLVSQMLGLLFPR